MLCMILLCDSFVLLAGVTGFIHTLTCCSCTFSPTIFHFCRATNYMKSTDPIKMFELRVFSCETLQNVIVCTIRFWWQKLIIIERKLKDTVGDSRFPTSDNTGNLYAMSF